MVRLAGFTAVNAVIEQRSTVRRTQSSASDSKLDIEQLLTCRLVNAAGGCRNGYCGGSGSTIGE